jgi:PAS domain S-box-containing protein
MESNKNLIEDKNNKIEKQPVIFVVEDDKSLNRLIQKKLIKSGFKTKGFFKGADTIANLSNNNHQLLVLDYFLPDMTGRQVVETLKNKKYDIPFVIMTGQGDEKTAVEMMKLGAKDYLVKDQNFIETIPKVINKVTLDLMNQEKLLRMKNALHESEERLNSFMESATDIFILCNAKFNIVEMNEAGLKNWNVTRSDILGKNIFNILPDLKNKKCNSDYFAVMQTGKPLFIDDVISHTKLGDKYLLMKFFKVGNGLGVIISDISKIKKVEQELKESEELYRTLVQTSPFGVTMSDLHGKIIFASPQTAAIHGYNRADQLVGKSAFELIHPNDHRRAMKNMEKTLKGELLKDLEYTLLKKDGTQFIGELNVSLVRNINGGSTAFIATTRDITERKQTEEKLRKYSKIQTILLREVNHRVKNNLTAIIAMLYQERDHAEEKGMKSALPILNSLAGRIQGLLMVHSMLSACGWSPLNLSELCKQITISVFKSCNLLRKINLKVPPSTIFLNSNQAYHLALVINELATNTGKYALKDRDKINIDINISKENNNVKIRYCDNGPGYPEAILQGDLKKASTGFELINGIVNQSLAGKVLLQNNRGAVTTIHFKNESASENREVK